MGKNTAIQHLSMYSEEVRNVAVSFVDVLDEGELLTDAVTVTQLSPATPAMTFANEAVNVAALTINNKDAAIGQAVQFKVTAPEVSTKTEFALLIEVATDATPAQAIKKRILLDVDVE